VGRNTLSGLGGNKICGQWVGGTSLSLQEGRRMNGPWKTRGEKGIRIHEEEGGGRLTSQSGT